MSEFKEKLKSEVKPAINPEYQRAARIRKKNQLKARYEKTKAAEGHKGITYKILLEITLLCKSINICDEEVLEYLLKEAKDFGESYLLEIKKQVDKIRENNSKQK